MCPLPVGMGKRRSVLRGGIVAARTAAMKLLSLLLLAVTAIAADRPPNIVIIFNDDMGYGDVGCFGAKYATPNIDKLAKEGRRFTNFHVSTAVCSASRAALVSPPRTAP